MTEEEKKGENVRVAIRVRPLSNKEIGNAEQTCLTITELGSGASELCLRDEEDKDQKFAFDMIFGNNSTQEDVYNRVGAPALDNTLGGFNGTIFAYGQTGSGKTFCMAGIPDDPGIIPRVNSALFKFIAEETAKPEATRKFLVQCSFFEIYNEVIFDLLNPPVDKGKLGGGLQIKEHPVLGIYVKDLQELVVTDAAKLMEIMDRGQRSRAVSATLMNATSSRSHSVFTIKVHQKDEEDPANNVFAKLNLVDLAGSERQKGTGASGQTLKEGANINKSLSALGNVINALVENATSNKKVFIPYRNSKLTRVLQESLGGNSLCTMLATLSPALSNFEETLSTVRYANRAKAIKVSAKKNEEASQISRLQAEVNELKKLLASGKASGGGGMMTEEEKKQVADQYEKQISEMNQFMKQTWEEKAKLSRKHEEQIVRMQEERARALKKMDEERAKRWRLLQEQNDVQLSLRQLGEAVAPLNASAKDASEPVSRTLGLMGPSVVTEWRALVKEVHEQMDEIRAQREAVLVFKTSLDSDVSHWKDSSEYSLEVHDSISRGAIKRAGTKLAKLRATADQLVNLSTEALEKVKKIKLGVKNSMDAWNKHGMHVMNFVTPKTEVDDEDDENATSDRQAQVRLQEQDVSRGVKLVSRQIRNLAVEIAGLGGCDLTDVSHAVVAAAEFELAGQHAAEEQLVPLRAGVGEITALLRPAREEHASPAPDSGLGSVSIADVTGTSEGADHFLSQVVSWDDLPKTKKTPAELLARPPPKFIYDVCLLVSDTTGFLEQIFSEELYQDWKNLESRETKVNFITSVVNHVAQNLQCEVEMTASDVLKGVNIDNTNKFFQLLAIGASKFGTKKKKPADAAQEELDDRTRPLLKAFNAVLDAQLQIIVQREDTRKQAGQSASPDGEQGSQRIKELERLLEEERAATKMKEKKLLEKLEKETAQRLAAEEDCDRHQAAVDKWEQDYQSKVEQEIGTAEARVQAMEATTREVQDELAALRAKNAAEQTSRLATIEQSAQGLEGDVKEQVLAEIARMKATMEQEIREKEALTDQVRQLKEEQSQVVAKAVAEANVEGKTPSKQARRPSREEDLEHAGSAAKRKQRAQAELMELKEEVGGSIGGPGGDGDDGLETKVLEMQAEKNKYLTRLRQLEDKLREHEEHEDAVNQEIEKLNSKTREYEEQLENAVRESEVLAEERDALKVASEQIWKEKTLAEEDAEERAVGYVALSDRLREEKERVDECEEQIREYEDVIRVLREQVGKREEEAQRYKEAAALAAKDGARIVKAGEAAAEEGYEEDFEQEQDFAK